MSDRNLEPIFNVTFCMKNSKYTTKTLLLQVIYNEDAINKIQYVSVVKGSKMDKKMK